MMTAAITILLCLILVNLGRVFLKLGHNQPPRISEELSDWARSVDMPRRPEPADPTPSSPTPSPPVPDPTELAREQEREQRRIKRQQKWQAELDRQRQEEEAEALRQAEVQAAINCDFPEWLPGLIERRGLAVTYDNVLAARDWVALVFETAYRENNGGLPVSMYSQFREHRVDAVFPQLTTQRFFRDLSKTLVEVGWLLKSRELNKPYTLVDDALTRLYKRAIIRASRVVRCV